MNSRQPLTAAASTSVTSEGGSIVWARDDVAGDATYSFSNLYQSGAPQEAVKTTADAAFGALATWLSEQQRLVERAFEVRPPPRRATRRSRRALRAS